MYERFFNLRERPFSLSPDPDYLYPSRVHQEALGYLRYGIEGHAGFVVITGEIGCGKTTLLQTVLADLDQQTSVSRLVNTMLDARELVEAVMLDFGLDPGHGRSKPYLLHDLARFLVDQRTAGGWRCWSSTRRRTSARRRSKKIRMMSNLETEKSKLIQILLVGQPNLRDLLGRPELEQLRQRVTVSYHLQPLDAGETAAYINHRLRRAAIGAPLEFSRDVTDLIHLHSQGVPRKINVIADAVLLFGYGEDRRMIEVDLTNNVLRELEGTGVLAPPVERGPGHRCPHWTLVNADLPRGQRRWRTRAPHRRAERALLRERGGSRRRREQTPADEDQRGERGGRIRPADLACLDYFTVEHRHPTAGSAPRPSAR